MVLHGRSGETVQRTRDAIRQAASNATLHTAHADLADLDAVALMAQDLSTCLPNLDVLINHAGLYMTVHKESKNGFEMTLAVSYISHFLLTML